VDGDHQIISDPDGIQSELAYLLINSARIEILGIAPQLLLEAIRRVTSRTGQEPPVMLAPIEYYTPAPEIVMAHLSEFAFGRVTRRWKSSLTAFRTMLSGQPDGQGQKPSYTSFSVGELFLDCCLIRLSRNDGTYHLVGLTVLPGVLGREYTIMWQLTSPPADLLKKFDAMLATKAPLIVREVHCKTVDQDVAIKISEGSLATDWQGPEIIQFHPYGVPAGDQNFLMPVAIVAIRAVTPRGTIVYLKRRTPLTDHNDFGVLSLLSARVQEEDLDIALNINLAGKPNDDHVAFEDTWLKAGQPNPFCSQVDKRAEDDAEDGQSVGVVVSGGKFRFIYLGDLTWNSSTRLFCPVNRVGTVDAYLVTHHAQAMTNELGDYYAGLSCCSIAEVRALHARVGGVVAVVAHHPERVRRKRHRVELLALVGRAVFPVHIRLVEPDSISVNHTAVDFQAVSWRSNQSLDQRLTDLGRIPEYDNVAMSRVLIGQQMLSERTRRRIRQFVH